jgi:hypothetical protein
MTGSEKVTWKADWNPVTNTTTITDNSGTRVVQGNQTSYVPVASEGRSRSAGVSPTDIVSGQASFCGGGVSPTGITADNNDPQTDKKKKKNDSGILEHSN